ncbi:hypothetical protein CONPUDRAFT_77749 [Coniophora puteana RWD-64-598 SS2]|uniref:Uncharacterized protein n=1 Tax=Coniophora puteana (strain RWD-64-598) TaxID=741705 RepID=A0A5M3M7X1_CONPW|nr:uncharacterized protein CONPUDRAFT_77749 [Coniophora puteana RWD-64-598 SS2]EIW74964.1 hypothetical protein CONPUDRAFT_77749 [Coniophora puteana RWD-64-598 SS2]
MDPQIQQMPERLDHLVDMMWLALPETIIYDLGMSGVLLTTRGRTSAMKPALIVEAVMFLVATTHLGANLCGIYVTGKYEMLNTMQVSFLQILEVQPTLVDLMQHRTAAMAISSAAFIAQLWLGDGFMRYILSNQPSWTSIAIGGLTYMPLVAVSLVVHAMCTIMIASRIIFLQRQVGGSVHCVNGISLTNVAITLLESAAVYSALMVALLVILTEVFIKSSSSRFDYMATVMNAAVPLIEVIFSAIITRMGLGVSVEIFKISSAGEEGKVAEKSAGATIGLRRT